MHSNYCTEFCIGNSYDTDWVLLAGGGGGGESPRKAPPPHMQSYMQSNVGHISQDFKQDICAHLISLEKKYIVTTV